MRDLHTIVIHYTATKPDQLISVDTIRQWHKARGFDDIGYHFVIDQVGRIERGRPIGKTGAHVANHNTGTVGVCYVGGLVGPDKGADTRTPAQKRALRLLVASLRSTFGAHLKVVGHRDLAATQCPGFDVQSERWPRGLDDLTAMEWGE